MNSVPPFKYAEGQHINKPPLFNFHYYAWWKARMEYFLQSQDYELWMTIINDPFIPMMKGKSFQTQGSIWRS